MGKLTVFNFVTLNGFYKGLDEDISWRKNDDPEKNEYAAEGLNQGARSFLDG